MKKAKNIIQTTSFLALGVIILYLVYSQESTKYSAQCMAEGGTPGTCSLHQKIWQDFQSVKIFWLVCVLLVYFISNVFRASRWKMLIEALGYEVKWSNAFWTTMLGYFTNLGLPRSGEFIRAASFARYEKLPTEKVMGTVVVDRIIDVLSLGVVFILGLVFSFDLLVDFLSANAQIPAKKLLWVSIGGVVGAVVVWWLLRTSSRSNNPLLSRLNAILRGLGDGIGTVVRLENTNLFLLHSLIIWVMYYLMMYLMFFAFAPTAHLGPVAALVVFIFGSIGMVVPSPGGVGTYQYMVMTGLTIYGLSTADGLSFSFIIFFAVNIFINIAFGLASLVILPYSNAGYKQEAHLQSKS